MIKKLKTNSKIFCFCENKPKCVSPLVHWSWLVNFNTNLTCFTFSPWYLPLICWRSLIFETEYPYFGRIVQFFGIFTPFLVFFIQIWYCIKSVGFNHVKKRQTRALDNYRVVFVLFWCITVDSRHVFPLFV